MEHICQDSTAMAQWCMPSSFPCPDDASSSLDRRRLEKLMPQSPLNCTNNNANAESSFALQLGLAHGENMAAQIEVYANSQIFLDRIWGRLSLLLDGSVCISIRAPFVVVSNATLELPDQPRTDATGFSASGSLFVLLLLAATCCFVGLIAWLCRHARNGNRSSSISESSRRSSFDQHSKVEQERYVSCV